MMVPVFDDLFRGAPVQRALAELRFGRPVRIQGATPVLVANAADALTPDNALLSALPGPCRLVLSGARLKSLGYATEQTGVLCLDQPTPAEVMALCLAPEASSARPLAPASDVQEAALMLQRLALLPPAALCWEEGPRPSHFYREKYFALVSVTVDEVLCYRAEQARALRLVARAPVPLAEGPTEFVVFRGGDGLGDHVAVVVGTVDVATDVLVRLHSACLTGDCFASLKCDCGDQLRASLRHMGAAGGGILLYLDQEGRGHGIANKISAYALQAQGYDTYDADNRLGLGDDQRQFDFAAAILRLLGVTKLRLLTNNPRKAACLREAGLEVTGCESVAGRVYPENRPYLIAKRDKGGHGPGILACGDMKT